METDAPRLTLTQKLAYTGGALALVAAALLFWVGHGKAVALALMAGDAILNCF